MLSPGDKLKKPEQWGFDRGWAADGWEWFWKDALSVLVFWEGGGPPFDLVRRKFATINGTPIWSANALGLAGESEADLEFWDLGDSSLILPTDQITVACIIEKTDGAARNSSTFGPKDASANRCQGHLPFNDGNYYWDFGGTTSGTSRLVVSSPAVSGIRRMVLRAGSRGMALWQNGVELGSHTTATPARTATTNVLKVNAGEDDADRIKFSMIGFFDAQWSDGEVFKWTNDPFGPFRMVDEAAFFVPAVGGLSIPVAMRSYRQHHQSGI